MRIQDRVRMLVRGMTEDDELNLKRSSLLMWLQEHAEATGGGDDRLTGQKVYDTTEASRLLSVSPATMAEWCKEERFPNAWKTGTDGGGEWRIPESDLLAVMGKRKNGGDRVRLD